MLGKLAITALMRRFPRPITPDNDTATKNARGITGPGHKPGSRSVAVKDSERAGPGGGHEGTSRARWCVRGVYARGPGWRSRPQPRPAAARRAAALSVFSQVKPDSSRPKWP